ncbi:putative integrase [Sulfurisphaera ohwakuensis]|uniref:ORF D-335-like domain-containing protein n=1 Tax=Sulfurisphaera ohwakuensis TaxID=69656 RepID=A0A650CDU6_SULOH|nr:putative integrase [Sulfurisphaera ohwakuensis]MBB5253136.1 hypothetical protein [Sulfurisphaera ohwakuensis]QGR15949.1 hypothetical protein D1869_01165 [Sulfurisphaera ohwakuensis]
MAKDKMRYKYGDIILRERKGQYYVYKLETINGEIKERYIGPLADVVETYLKLKESGGVGVSPTTGPPGFEPGTTGSEEHITLHFRLVFARAILHLKHFEK